MALSVVDAEATAPARAEVDWPTVQLAQFEHDEKYHREICRLSTQDRLRHMALHFAKYAGQLQDDPSEQQFRKNSVDSMIIGVSCANILNVDLAEALMFDTNLGKTRSAFVKRLAISAGRMAAACEKLDHLEDFPFRQTLIAETLAILAACVSLFVSEGWEPSLEMKDRLKPVKGKSIFHGKI